MARQPVGRVLGGGFPRGRKFVNSQLQTRVYERTQWGVIMHGWHRDFHVWQDCWHCPHQSAGPAVRKHQLGSYRRFNGSLHENHALICLTCNTAIYPSALNMKNNCSVDRSVRTFTSTLNSQLLIFQTGNFEWGAGRNPDNLRFPRKFQRTAYREGPSERAGTRRDTASCKIKFFKKCELNFNFNFEFTQILCRF